MIFLASNSHFIIPSFLTDAFSTDGAGSRSRNCCFSTCLGTIGQRTINPWTFEQINYIFTASIKITIPAGVSSISKTLAGHLFTNFSAVSS